MTNREMLKFAAKAAGLHVGFERDGKDRGRYDLYWSIAHNQLVWHGKSTGSEYPRPIFWNPLTNDGDALRLAVRLGMNVLFTPEDVEVIADQHAKEDGGEMVAPWACESWTLKQQDLLAATRRAIVRAAAEIGRQMP